MMCDILKQWLTSSLWSPPLRIAKPQIAAIGQPEPSAFIETSGDLGWSNAPNGDQVYCIWSVKYNIVVLLSIDKYSIVVVVCFHVSISIATTISIFTLAIFGCIDEYKICLEKKTLEHLRRPSQQIRAWQSEMIRNACKKNIARRPFIETFAKFHDITMISFQLWTHWKTVPGNQRLEDPVIPSPRSIPLRKLSWGWKIELVEHRNLSTFWFKKKGWNYNQS